ncbi:hypothetical protein LP7551_04141 [Roseibium album]|nr:hypothetical protein LP7551_04141 [Roseibium album]
MFAVNRLSAASFIAFSVLLCMRGYAETGLTSKEFLTWSENNKSSYVQISMMSMNMIALENDQKQSDCIGAWFTSDRRAGEQYIYEVMQKAPDFHPVGVIMAVLEKKCGPFKYR